MYIRTRLTLWFLLVVLLLLSAFSVTIYQLAKRNLVAEIDQDVRHQAAILQATIHPCPGSATLCVPKLDVFQSPDTFLQVQDQRGTILARSGNLGQWKLPLLSSAIAANQVQELPVEKTPLFVYGQPIIIDHQVRGYIIVAHSPQAIYLALGQLLYLLYPGVAVALGLAALVIWLLVRHEMLPLEQLATSAAEIAVTKDHSRRLAPRPRHDEIGRLAQTINDMLHALEDAYQEMQKASDLQRQFLLDVSHELRTPLTVMLSSLDLINKVGAADPEFQASSLERVRAEANRMARMVSQLLILARSDAQVTAAYEPVLLRDLLADICSQWPTTEREPTLECRDLEGLEGVLVWGNPDYLKQLFLILLDNACKYTPPDGSVTLLGGLEGGIVSVTVADTGMGIPVGNLPRIFERFYRAENARSQPGAGLGLAIAQRIAEQHGGKIEVESAEGRGSRFLVILPCL